MSLPQEKIYTSEDYWNLPEGIRAELINGHIYNMAPPSRIHQKIMVELCTIINTHIKSKKGTCQVYPAPFAVNLDANDKDWVEPDISVICDPNKLTDRGCSGAPDWIIEIVSPGNPGHDFINKLNLYSKFGVREYWIADPRSQSVLVYYLEQKDFCVRTYSFQDKIKVNIYEDFWIDFQDLDL